MAEPDAKPEVDEKTEEEAPPQSESAAEASTAAAEDVAAPKKKKKKKKASEVDEPKVDDPKVREIEAMFAAGDYERTREIANELAASTDPRLADVGRDYLHRTGVDPIQLAFLGACAAVLIAIAWIYIPH